MLARYQIPEETKQQREVSFEEEKEPLVIKAKPGQRISNYNYAQ